MIKPDWERDGIDLYLGDCLDVLPQLPPGSVDAVVTDPPYGIGYASSWTTRLNGEPRVHGASFGADHYSPEFLAPAYRSCGRHAILYLFTRWDIAHRWKADAERAGWHITQRLLWDKKHWKMGDLRYYGSQTEDVLFGRKGTPVMQYAKRRGNVFSFSSSYLPEGQYDHPTQKPEALIREFLNDSVPLGGAVLDPFMGSGTTGVACVQTGRRFIGVEKEPKYFDIAVKRIEKALADKAEQLDFAGATECAS